MTEAAERSVHSHPKYHHGRSPAAWAGVAISMVGFFVGSVGFLIGEGPDISPHWVVVGIGAGIILVGFIVTMVLRAVGLGND